MIVECQLFCSRQFKLCKSGTNQGRKRIPGGPLGTSFVTPRRGDMSQGTRAQGSLLCLPDLRARLHGQASREGRVRGVSFTAAFRAEIQDSLVGDSELIINHMFMYCL